MYILIIRKRYSLFLYLKIAEGALNDFNRRTQNIFV